MKDEIKEILEKPKILMLSYGNYISINDYDKLKDYITNLQEELEEEKRIEEASLDTINNLQEENDRLNNEIKTLLKENSNKEKVIIKQNNIINRMEEDLKEMYLTFGEFNEEYTEKKIQELKGGE